MHVQHKHKTAIVFYMDGERTRGTWANLRHFKFQEQHQQAQSRLFMFHFAMHGAQGAVYVDKMYEYV